MTEHELQTLPDELATGLRHLNLRVRGLAVMRGMGVLCVVIGAALATGLLIDWVVDVGVVARTSLLIAAVAAALLTLAVAVVWPLVRRASASELAALVDAAYPELSERIESAVELTDSSVPERHRGSPMMRGRLLEETARRADTVDFTAAADATTALRWVSIGAVTVVLLLAPLLVFRDGYGLLLSRFLMPWRNLERATNLYFVIEDGDRFVARGSDVSIAAEPRWRVRETALPDHAWLHWHNGSRETESRRMRFDAAAGAFQATIPHVLTSFDYEVSAGRTRTRAYHIDVVDAPVIERLTLEIVPPAYTGRPVRILDGPVGRIEVFQHSQLTFRAAFSKPVNAAELQWRVPDRGIEVAAGPRDVEGQLNVDAKQSEVAFPFLLADDRRSGTLQMAADRGGLFDIALRDQHDVRSPVQEPRELVIQADEPPVVQWADVQETLTPGATLEVRPDEEVSLPLVAEDDIGVAELELHAEVVQRSKPLDPLSADSTQLGRAHLDHTFRWDLSPFSLQEGDLLAVRARAVDGRPVPGPQEAWTASRLIRISIDAESMEKSQLAREQQRLRDILEAIRQNVQQDRSTTDSLRASARAAIGQDSPASQQKEIAQLAQREQELMQRLEQLAAVFDEHPLQRNMSDETRAVGSGPLDAARQQFQQAQSAPPHEQLERLTKAADELARADDELTNLLETFDELAALEQDLLRLQQLAEHAERLSDAVTNFEQQWEQLTNAQELADEQRRAVEEALAEQHETLQGDQESLAGGLDRLLEERPEVLDAATGQQLAHLQQLGEQASRLAAREDRLADALEQEPDDSANPSGRQPNATGEQPDASTTTTHEPDAATTPAGQETQTSNLESQISNPPNKDRPPPETAGSESPQQPPGPSEPAEHEPTEPAESGERDPTEPTESAEDGVTDSTESSQVKRTEPTEPVNDDLTEPTNLAESDLTKQQQQLAAVAARLALETARNRGVQTPSAQTAREFAENSLRAAEEAQTGLLNDAADSANAATEAARQTAAQLDDPTDPAPARLREQSQNLAEQQAVLAEKLREQAASPDARRRAQADGQRQLAEETRSLAERLQQIAVRLGTAPLNNDEQSDRAGSVRQSADEAFKAMQSAQQQLQQGNAPAAVPQARSAAESLRSAASQAGANPTSEESTESPVPGEVGEQVADARRHLQQAGEQLRQNGPSPSDAGEPAENPDQRSPSEQSDSPANAESPNAREPSNESSPDEQTAPQPNAEPQSPAPQTADGNASESMKQVAESLRQAAVQLGMAPSPSGESGDQAGDPSQGAPGSQSGNSGENPLSLVELETALQKMSTRNWGQLPGRLESELLQSTQKKPDGEYARLIRLYFEEISRQRSATQTLDANDNEL